MASEGEGEEEGEDAETLCVGDRIRVYWAGARRWFAGRVARLPKAGARQRLTTVRYDDGESRRAACRGRVVTG